MIKCSLTRTPIAIKPQPHPKDSKLADPTEYRKIVGSLQYLIITRPNIIHVVNKVCQYFQAPTIVNLGAAKQIFQYLKGIWIMD